MKKIYSCNLFGIKQGGIVFTPGGKSGLGAEIEGNKQPNFFWRFCQYVLLGNKWFRNFEAEKDFKGVKV